MIYDQEFPYRGTCTTLTGAMEQRAIKDSGRRLIDAPTVAVAAAIALGFTALLLVGGRLPWPLTVAVGGVLGGWYGSLQHEVVHGQPTASRRFNHALVWLPLSLTYPFQRYVATHMDHHLTSDLTIPGEDPESNFVSAETWAGLGPVRRGWLWVHRTLGGRLVLGPLRGTATLLVSEAQLIARGEAGVARAWVNHIAGCGVVGALVYVSDVTWWEYVLGAGYVGLSLTMLRSFAEHLDVADGTRTAYVEAGWFFSLLFLNNNLHHAHHARPGSAWHELPKIGRELGSADISAAGAGRYRGYSELFRRYFFLPLHHPVNALTARIGA
jgi:fatty acid desaturase